MAPNPRAYLLRFGELALKGRNRRLFEDDLVQALKPRVESLEGVIKKRHKKMVLETTAEPARVKRALAEVFGISGVSPIWRSGFPLEEITELSWSLAREHAGSGKTFAVKVHRANKNYPISSMDLQKKIADDLFRRGLDLKVDLKNPDWRLGVIVDFDCVNLFLETWPGLGGLPVSAVTKHALLLSGGIDSPVAGRLIQKRGGRLIAVYFHTPPFTVEAAKEKVVALAELLARCQNALDLFVVNFTEPMKAIRAECAEEYVVVLARRMMMRTAVDIAKKANAKSIVTGENLGQVASQTIENIAAIGECSSLPVLRPLIGFDKHEIIALSEQIGAYPISIRPFQDCCSLFSPKDPVTRSKLHLVHRQEERLDVAELTAGAVAQTEKISLEADFAF